MIATDAIFSSKPLDIQISDQLGDFDVKVFKKLLLVQPGFYFGLSDDDKLQKSRSRGMSSKAFKDLSFDQITELILSKTEIKIYRDVLHSWRLCLAQNAPQRIGQWTTEPQTLTLGGTKRQWIDDIGYPISQSTHFEYDRLMGIDRILDNLFDLEIDDSLDDGHF